MLGGLNPYLQTLVAKGLQSCKKVKKVVICSLDVRRAFDQVLHNRLLLLLQSHGVPDCLLGLLRSYLQNCVAKISAKAVSGYILINYEYADIFQAIW